MLARWKSHKVVSAGKVLSVNLTDMQLGVENDAGGIDLVYFTETLVSRSIPQLGDYYVVYEDGYASWSPAKAFEEGYSQIKE